MEYSKEIKNRLKRIEGQVKGIIGMMEQEKDCKSVISQLSAARNAIDRAIAVIVSSNLEQCIRESLENGEKTEHLVKEAVELLVKSR
ncbi:metal-sensitive transcriptional regulator [Aeribacillus sp. FSL K6-2833]|uniref:metal-sensitive transcriptional regulator n=1 Tax=Aeribacillus sp. FSL K6-2833 TaxID=2954611 RepID=UPI0030D91413